jgi:hypothetical protein
MGEECSTCIQSLGGRTSRNEPLGRPRRRWDDNIKINLKEEGWGREMDWIDLAWDRDRQRVFVNAVINLRVPYSGEYLIS